MILDLSGAPDRDSRRSRGSCARDTAAFAIRVSTCLAYPVAWPAANWIRRTTLYSVQDLSGANERQAVRVAVSRCKQRAYVLSRAGGGRAFAFETPDDLATLDVPLADALRTLAIDPGSFGIADPTAWAPYEAKVVTQRFADIFDRLAALKGSAHRLRPWVRSQPADPRTLPRGTLQS